MIYYLTLLVFFLNNAIFVHVVIAILYSHVIMVAISEAYGTHLSKEVLIKMTGNM